MSRVVEEGRDEMGWAELARAVGKRRAGLGSGGLGRSVAGFGMASRFNNRRRGESEKGS